MGILTRQVPHKFTSLISLLALLLFLPLLLLATYQTVTLISRAVGTPAAVVVNTTEVLEDVDTTFYHAFSQGGEESKDMLAPVVSEVRSLSPKLLRIDHIYDHYDVVGRDAAGLTFDFSRLDSAVGTILATGAKPLLVLSFMPQAIAKDGNIINPPNDWNEWALVVQRTIEHYSGRSGKNIRGVYYEVWNEPDLAQFGGWKYGGDKNYITLYRYASQGAQNAKGVNEFALGGPSTTGLYKSWIIALVNSGARLDFLSWHTYDANPTKFTSDQRNLANWLLPYPGKILIPKLITEFGFTGAKDARYGTSYAAAHTAAVVRQLISGGPQFALSFQPKDGPNQQAGDGWGLLTHEDNGKRPKPRYYLYNFLDAMAGKRLELRGEGTWVTGFASTRSGIFRVMLVNFDRGGSHTENVPVTFVGLANGAYTYTEKLLSGRNITRTETAADGAMGVTVYMPAQSVAILELKKQ
jgi:hypothetical protein